MKRTLLFCAGTVFGIALVATCSSSGGGGGQGAPSCDMAGSVVDLLRADLAGTVADLLGVDLGIADAHAAPPLSGDCNKVWSYKTNQNGIISETDNLYAEFVVPGYDPRNPDHLTAWICDPTGYGGMNQNGSAVEAFYPQLLPPSTMADPIPKGKCAQGYATGDAGIVRVVCGSKGFSNGALIYGNIWAKVYLKVGP